MNCIASKRSHAVKPVFVSVGETRLPSLAAPEVVSMAKDVKVTGQEQSNENNQGGCGHKNPFVFSGHVLRFSQNLVCVNCIRRDPIPG
jgi:hypothetical protein